MTSEAARRGAVLLGPDEGRSVWTLGGRFTLKADGDAAEGRLSVLEATVTRAAEPPLHVHRREDEAWYVLEGAMTFYLGDTAYRAAAGSFVLAPMGVPHVFTVDLEPTRVLLLASPAGFEHFALELGVPAEGDEPPAGLALPAPEVLDQVALRYGIEIVGPPRRISHPDEA